jgi:prolyl 4-hydroxylase
VERGCSRDELFRILIDEGFDDEAVAKALNHRPSVELSRITNPLRPKPKVVAGGASAPSAALVPNLKRFESTRLELYTADNFLSSAECDRIASLMRSHLRKSTITVPDEPDKYFRVSSTCDLGMIHDEAARALDRKICAALQTTEAYAEPTQGQHYDPGGEFKAHTDYFEAHELERFSTPTLGQRSWTFMIYLNDPEAGGETAFTNVGLVVKPKKGTAVIWNSLTPDGRPNPDSIHHGMPVKVGYKDIVTKWFRVPR